MAFPGIFQKLFENDGAGPLLKPGLIPLDALADGESVTVRDGKFAAVDAAPPLAVRDEFFPLPGHLDMSLDNGALSRAAFPQAFAQLERYIADGFVGYYADDAQWQAEAAANGGLCGKFSLGDGATTFRIPRVAGAQGFPPARRPLIKMYGTVAAASEANIAALVQAVAAKLDSAAYAAHNAFSTTERDTGQKWLDGRTIYAKVIPSGALPGTTTALTHKYIDHGITNLSRFIGLWGIAYNPGTSEIELPFANIGSSPAGVMVTYQSGQFRITSYGYAYGSFFSESYLFVTYLKTK